jgi:hypothetical protein
VTVAGGAFFGAQAIAQARNAAMKQTHEPLEPIEPLNLRS